MSEKPYVVSAEFGDSRSFATFAEALAEHRKRGRSAARYSNIYNADNCDADWTGDGWTFHDGLTEEEREQL